MLKRLLIFFLAVPVFAQVGGISRSTTPSSGDYGFWNRTNATIKPKTTTDTTFVNYLKSTGYVSLTSAIGTAADVWIRRVNPGRFVFGTTATDSAGHLSLGSLTTTGNIGGGTASPAERLDVVSAKVLFGADHADATLRTDATTKSGRMGFIHYTNSEEMVGGIMAYNQVTSNEIFIGGGSSTLNAATTIAFYTAANTTTITGTERMRISNSGDVGTGTTTSRHKNSSVASFATNLNALNWYNSDKNLNVSTAAQERDTSSIAGWFSGAGTPTFAIVNALGATQFKSDSLGLTWGGGTTVKKILSATAAYNFGSIAAQTDSVTTITLTGAVAGDDVSVGVSAAMEAGLVVWAECTTNDQVRVHVTNISAGAVDPANRTYRATTRGF